MAGKFQIPPKAPDHKSTRPNTGVAPVTGLPERLEGKTKVAIVGYAPHNQETPWDDPALEVWGINRLNQVLEGRWDRWFELHDITDYDDSDTTHAEFLASFDGDVFLRPVDVGIKDIPNAKPFPIDALLREFPPYFTNTISYLVALAILMEYEEIHLYGVDMAQDHITQQEFGEQRPSVEFFLGLAAGKGIDVILPPGSDLLVSSYLYGFGEPSPWRAKHEARMVELGQRKEVIKAEIAKRQAEVTQLTANLNQLDGAMQQIHYDLRNLSPQRSK